MIALCGAQEETGMEADTEDLHLTGVVSERGWRVNRTG